MIDPDETQRWVGRRTFLLGGVRAGLSLTVLGSLLEACGRENHPDTGTADLPPMEKELHIYNWSDYIAEDTVPNFEKEFGVQGDLRHLREQRGDGGQAPGGRQRVRHHRPQRLHHPGAGGHRPDRATSTRSTSPTPGISRRSSRTFRPTRQTGTPCPGSGGPPASPTGPTRSRVRWTAGPCSTIKQYRRQDDHDGRRP